MYKAKIVTNVSKKHQDNDDIDEQAQLVQEAATSVIVGKRGFDQLNTMPKTESLIVKKIRDAIYLDGKETVSSLSAPAAAVVHDELTVDDCVKLTPKDETIDSSELDYAVRLKMKYGHLLIKDIAERVGVNPKSLSGKIARKKKVLALDEQPQKIRSDSMKNDQVTVGEAVKELEDAGGDKNDPSFGVVLRNRYPHLLIKNIAAYLGVKESTLKDRVYRTKLQGGVSKTLDMCMREMPFDDKYKDAVDYGIQIKNKYNHIVWRAVAQKLNVSENTMKKRVQQKKIEEEIAKKSPGHYVSLLETGSVIDVNGSVSSTIVDSLADSTPSTSTPVFFLPKKQVKGKLSDDINDCIRDTPRGADDSDDYAYAIRLKKKYHASLTYSSVALYFGLNVNTLMTKSKKASEKTATYKNDTKVDIDECMRDTPRDKDDDYEYAIRLKLKYNHLSYRALAEKFPEVSKTGLAIRLKQHISDNKIKTEDVLNISSCINTLIDEGMSRDSYHFGFHLKRRFPGLAVRGIARELNIDPGTLRQRIDSIGKIYNKDVGEVTLDECFKKMPYSTTIYSDKYEYGILLQSRYPHLSMTKIADKLGLSKYTIQSRRDSMRRRIDGGKREVDLTSYHQKRKELKSSFKLKKDVGDGVKNELRLMCRMAHEKLQDIEQKRSTTAVGVDVNGKYFLASSDAYIKAPMRTWANADGISMAKGEGHAEVKMLRDFPDIVHIEVSRDICLECEIKLLESGVGTTTKFSGALSQKATRNIQNKQSSSSIIL